MKRLTLIAALCFLTSWAIASEFEDKKALAEQGDARAQYETGVAYVFGQGVPQDYAEAVKWFRMAADHGYANAQYNLGVMYADGEGVPQNYAEAYVRSGLAVASGDEYAKHNRDLYASKLSPADLGAAQKRAAKLFEEIQQRKK
jgi:TPR repeat protein